VLSNATNSPTTVALSGTGAAGLVSVSLSPTSASLQASITAIHADGDRKHETRRDLVGDSGSISSSGLFAAPTVSVNTTVTVTGPASPTNEERFGLGYGDAIVFDNHQRDDLRATGTVRQTTRRPSTRRFLI